MASSQNAGHPEGLGCFELCQRHALSRTPLHEQLEQMDKLMNKIFRFVAKNVWFKSGNCKRRGRGSSVVFCTWKEMRGGRIECSVLLFFLNPLR